jgi:hypothetical protein
MYYYGIAPQTNLPADIRKEQPADANDLENKKMDLSSKSPIVSRCAGS